MWFISFYFSLLVSVQHTDILLIFVDLTEIKAWLWKRRNAMEQGDKVFYYWLEQKCGNNNSMVSIF